MCYCSGIQAPQRLYKSFSQLSTASDASAALAAIACAQVAPPPPLAPGDGRAVLTAGLAARLGSCPACRPVHSDTSAGGLECKGGGPGGWMPSRMG